MSVNHTGGAIPVHAASVSKLKGGLHDLPQGVGLNPIRVDYGLTLSKLVAPQVQVVNTSDGASSAAYPGLVITDYDATGFWVILGGTTPNTNSSLRWDIGKAGGSTGYLPTLDPRVSTYTASPVEVSPGDLTVRLKMAAPGAVAVNLPAGISRKRITFKDVTGDAATNNITIVPDGSDTIEGGANFVIAQNRASYTFLYTLIDSHP